MVDAVKICFTLCLIHVYAFITKLLSTWLLILLSVFLVGEVWSQHLFHLGTQLKVLLVHKHLSHLGMQLKDAVYKNLCSLTKFIISSAVMALAVSLSWHERGKKLWWEWRRLTRKLKRRQGAKMQPLCHEVRGKIDIHIFHIICVTFLPENKATVHIWM